MTALLLLFSSFEPNADAIENGTNAAGSAYVVPIKSQYSATNMNMCSGVLISSSIVATAGHCVLDSDGLMTNKVYVGDPGSDVDSITLADIVSSVQITSGFKNGSGNTVGVDDIVFLVLGKSKAFNSLVRLASEAEVQSLKSKGSTLKLYGYGAINNSGESAKYPNSTDGTFSTLAYTGQPDSAFVKPISQNICKGDSGGPVLSISATEILVVGIITGGDLRSSCAASQASFTLVSRYTNLAFSAAVTQMNNLEAQLKKTTDEAIQGIKSIETVSLAKIDAAQKSARDQAAADQLTIDDLNTRISELEAQIVTLKEQLPKTITCTKGKLTKKVTGVRPVCPAGYKQK